MPGSVSFSDLPFDILDSICRELCLHCRGRQCGEYIVGVPVSVTLCAREDKRALARLSRTCKTLNAVAQPIVFHYFHSGNQPWMKSGQNEHDRSRWDQNEEDDFLLPFIHSLVERPDLAREVRALSLYYSYSQRSRDWDSALESQFVYVAKSIGLGTARLKDYPQELAIALTPNIQQLLVSLDWAFQFEGLEDFPNEFCRLEYVAAPAAGAVKEWVRKYHFYGLRPLLVRAPNLKILDAADCSGQGRHDQPRDLRSWNVPLDKVKKLTISHLHSNFIAKVLRSCPVLEEFEVWTGDRGDAGLSIEDLLPIRHSIRRLCYTTTDPDILTSWWRSLKADNETTWFCFGSGPVVPRHDYPELSFVDFPRLEILEVDQQLLYSRRDGYYWSERVERFARERTSGPEKFMSKLPPSLRVLHVGMVAAWLELHRDLKGLAAVASFRFPSLEVIRLDCYMSPPPDESEYLKMAFKTVNISLVLAPMPMGEHARGMLGDRPGHPIVMEEPCYLFPLEG